ncbi:helix-turn-helix transcriptional regulator [Natronosalvus halobius]|uniref:helix-turn-helix transcriptional regulator n=1 Tax=Natronosalvus halobius TaxID=2953746 RepID=UPI00209F0FF8|nr:helix-turn-helix domain-containing protein [Natronosalvus halobius]USZ70939.1 helix-turn-helix domain-containing protein [Natronosalvus halobius]
MGSALEDVEYLARSSHRVTVLASLSEAPRTRAELQESTGASASTISRTLRTLEQRRWAVRNGHCYEATPLGAYVATGVTDLLERLEAERNLRDIWDRLPVGEIDGGLEEFADAVVTPATVEDPYGPVSRFLALVEESDTFRFVGFELGLIEPCMDDLCRQITDGLKATIIDLPNVANYIRSTYPDLSTRTLRSGNLTALLHDDPPPNGLSLFDDRVGLCVYAPDTGTLQAMVDTDSLAVRTWAEQTFDQYRQAARPLALEAETEIG